MCKNDGLLIVFSGPSGSGKDSVLNMLKSQGNDIQLSISLTTREPRAGEQDGLHYFFVTHEDFEKKIAAGEVLEYAQYNAQYYGTPKTAVDEWLAQGKTVILEIEVEGAGNIRRIYPDCVSVFLIPPSIETLRERLRGRQSNTEADIERRIDIAKKEIPHAHAFDYVILNDKLDQAVQDFCAIIQAEQLRTSRNFMLEEVMRA